MSENINRFLGDTPARTLIKLIIISLVVGIIMSAIGYTPIDVLNSLLTFIERLWLLGFEAFGRFGEYLIYGAIVVVPIFLLSRILSYRG